MPVPSMSPMMKRSRPRPITRLRSAAPTRLSGDRRRWSEWRSCHLLRRPPSLLANGQCPTFRPSRPAYWRVGTSGIRLRCPGKSGQVRLDLHGASDRVSRFPPLWPKAGTPRTVMPPQPDERRPEEVCQIQTLGNARRWSSKLRTLHDFDEKTQTILCSMLHERDELDEHFFDLVSCPFV